MKKYLFVCLGNICRSPTAEGVMLHLIAERGLTNIVVDSAGTSAYHVGEKADPRSAETARRRGIDLPSRARQFVQSDFDNFDVIFAMDNSNLRNILRLARNDVDRSKVHLFRNFDANSPKDADMPDPYYGGGRGFEEVLDLCIAGCEGFLATVQPK